MKETLEDFSLSKSIQTKRSQLHKVGIVGCGSMGQEIARLVSKAGIEVHFVDVSDEQVNIIMAEIGHQLDEVIQHWGLTQSEKKAIMSRITGSADFNDLADCDIIVETINSRKPGTNLELRKEVFRKVEAVVRQDTVIASNTSTLMISELANVLRYPERAVGLHFISPATDVKIVEVVQGVKTSEEAYDLVLKFARMIGKKVINLNESPGIISTRLIVTLINEACNILMEGVACLEAIDNTMKMGYGLQFGPFEMADRIGLDKVLKWMDNLHQEFGEPQFKANPIIKRLVRANYLGRKSGIGFYKYEKGRAVGQTISCAEFNLSKR
ncbi:MAG TPA: 3-hydroxyacyl-CoA dehydrogenase family protein [Bacteroidales bacterium]|nr:3-hydroxyacyl-CoA dehydrogenase family protein [Bacteroidales bacterium]